MTVVRIPVRMDRPFIFRPVIVDSDVFPPVAAARLVQTEITVGSRNEDHPSAKGGFSGIRRWSVLLKRLFVANNRHMAYEHTIHQRKE